jgi:tetratricopeptide (TPR) repeat protein
VSNLNSDQVDEIFETAERYRQNNDHDALYALLEPLSDGNSVGPPHLGQLYYYLGEACIGLNSLDAAMQYLEAAEPVANGELRQTVRARIAEIGRRDDAISAVVDGIDGVDEASAALRAGDDLIARNEHDAARQWFQYAWDGVQMTDAQVGKAALGLARCEINDGNLDEAEGYLQVAEARDSALASDVTTLRTHISERRAGEVGGDGVAVGETDRILRAAVVAYTDYDFDTAKTLFTQLLDSGAMAGTDRGRVWRYLGAVHIRQHDYVAARAALEEAAAAGSPAIQAQAQVMISRIDDNAEAEAIVAGLDLDAD